MEKKILIEIDHDTFSKMTALVSDSLTGNIGTTEFEDRVNTLGKKVPYLEKVAGACVTAMNRARESGSGPIHDDTQALRQFLEHNEMFCFLQGAVAMLMVVGETLEKTNGLNSDVSKSLPAKPSRKVKRRG